MQKKIRMLLERELLFASLSLSLSLSLFLSKHAFADGVWFSTGDSLTHYNADAHNTHAHSHL
jgi:hypothetical protein